MAPGGEVYTTNNTLLNATAVQEPMAEFIGEFSTKTGYVSQTVGGQEGSPTGGTQDPVDGGSTTDNSPAQSAPDIHGLMMQGWEVFRKHAPLHAGFLKGFFIDGVKGDIDLAGDIAETLWNLRSPAQNAVNFLDFANKWIIPVATVSEEDIAQVTETLQTFWSLFEKLKSGRVNELTPEELHYHYLLVTIMGEVAVLLEEELGKLDPTETTGRIIGLISYEIMMEVALGALVVATFGGSGAAGAGKLATLPAKLRNIGGVGDTIADAVENGRLGTRLRELINDVTDIPYNSLTVREALEARYPGQVKSTTVPPVSAKNAHLAGTRHEATGIVFDSRGFPILDDIAKADFFLDAAQVAGKNYTAQMRAATRNLRDLINSGKIPSSQFTESQLKAIQAGKAQIPGLTWHHHQNIGRMQLVPRDIHGQVGHIGGFEMWYGY